MKKCIILLSLFGLLSFPTYASEMVDDFYDMAKNFFDSGEYVQAYEYAKQVLNINPKHMGANYLIIKLTSPDSFLKETSLSSHIIIRPTNAITNNNASDKANFEGQTFYKQKKYESARDCFLKALKCNHNNKYAYNNLGLCYWKLQDYKKAENAFKKANNIDEYFTAPLVNLAQMLLLHDDYKNAEKYLTLAIEKNKKDYSAFYLLGILNKLQGNYSNAIKYLNSASLLKPNFALTYLQMGDTYYLTKDFSWSNSTIERYIRLCPNDDYAYFMLHRNYLMLKKYELSKQYLIKAIMKNNCIDYRIAIAGLEGIMDNPKGAIDSLRVIPNPTAEILNEIGQYYLKLQDNDNALKYFKEACTKPYARPIYFYNVARVYKNTGDQENYQKMIIALESMSPQLCQDYIDLSEIYLDYASKNKAIEILNKGLKAFPKNKSIYNAKLKIYQLTSDKTGEEKIKKDIDRIFK